MNGKKLMLSAAELQELAPPDLDGVRGGAPPVPFKLPGFPLGIVFPSRGTPTAPETPLPDNVIPNGIPLPPVRWWP
jgi:hypothetical protein